jgi:putative FmdB family regulatory protein
MPTYEFRCPDGHDFEKFFRSISAAPSEVSCPVCGKIAERLLSGGGGLLFKGSGFYITDYGKDGKKSQTPSSSGGDKGPSGADKGPSGADKGPSGADSPAAKSDATPSKSGESKPTAANPTPAAKSNKSSKAGE